MYTWFLIISDQWGTKYTENQHSDNAIPCIHHFTGNPYEKGPISLAVKQKILKITAYGRIFFSPFLLLEALKFPKVVQKSPFLTSKPGGGHLLEYVRIPVV